MRKTSLLLLPFLILLAGCAQVALGFVAIPSNAALEAKIEIANEVVEELRPELPGIIESRYPNVDMLEMKGSRIFRIDVDSDDKPDVAIAVKIVYGGENPSRDEILELVKREVVLRIEKRIKQ